MSTHHRESMQTVAGACPISECSGDTSRLYRLARFDVVHCRECDIRFRWPLPDEHELRALYEDERYHASNYFAGQLAAEAAAAIRPETRIYHAVLDRLAAAKRPGAKLLDVGCGTGFFLSLAANRGFAVEGIELSAALCRTAADTFGVPVRCGEFTALPLAHGAYDVVTMWDLLEHVVDPVAALQHARRLLRPDGVLVILTLDSGSLFNDVAHVMSRVLPGMAQRPLELLYDVRHNYYFTTASLDRLITSQGFVVGERMAYRAHLGRWLSEPASPVVRIGGAVIDAASVLLRRQYRQLLLCDPGRTC